MGLFKRKEPELPESVLALKAAIKAAAEAAKATDCELEVHIDYEK
jgi:hypothetical protein